MGTDDLFKKRGINLKRKIAQRLVKKRILIVCEGEKTEPNYFKSFRITSADIIGKGFNTESLVNFAKEQEEKAKEEKIPYDQIWCVFDKDSFSKTKFNTAIQQAETYGFKIAYSNECFELWYLLHFEYITSALTREQYNKKLTKLLKEEYKKNSMDMYDVLLPKQKQAIRNAKKLLKNFSNNSFAEYNPSTTVYLLVEELNKLKSIPI